MPEQKKEKLDFLKREEIKTMAKDLAFLRELEAKKQREKIASIKLKEDRLAQEKKLEQIPKQVKDKPKKIFSISEKPKISSRSKKILVRGIIILLFVLFLGAIAWFFWPKEKSFIPESEQEIFEPIEQEVEEELELQEQGALQEETTQEPETPTPETWTPYWVERPVELGYHIPKTPRTIDTIIIHSAYNSLEGDPYDIEKIIQIFQDYRVTTHYLIARDNSTIYRLVPDRVVAYHAGFSKMPDGSRIDIINDFSIGIEVVYTKTDAPTEDQYQALAQLVRYLQQEYNILPENTLGHNVIAPERKTDPWNFDWEYFYSLLPKE